MSLSIKVHVDSFFEIDLAFVI